MKSVISGGMYVGNDTSHDGRDDFFARNRVPSVMQPFSKKWLCHFFDRQRARPQYSGRALLHVCYAADCASSRPYLILTRSSFSSRAGPPAHRKNAVAAPWTRSRGNPSTQEETIISQVGLG